MEKPKYDTIRGSSPTIAIEQKTASKNPRSTVGTITEVYDYLRVLFARIGEQFCIGCGQRVGHGNAQEMVEQIAGFAPKPRSCCWPPSWKTAKASIATGSRR
jgi:excinuclease ABC subunit A